LFFRKITINIFNEGIIVMMTIILITLINFKTLNPNQKLFELLGPIPTKYKTGMIPNISIIDNGLMGKTK
jgi:hypothetical protein